MPGDIVTNGFDLIETYLSRNAAYQIHFDRNETDSYGVDVRPSNSGRSTLITKEQVLPLLPAGSRWDAARGWRSFFGLPFSTPAESWMVLGSEGVVAHRTRGSYPIFRGLLFPSQEVPEKELFEMTNEIARSTEGEIQPKRTYGVIAASSQSQEEHKYVEAWIIRRAVASYRAGVRLLFRTLVLSENEIPSRTIAIDYSDFLIATLPALHDCFSWRTNTWLKLHERLNDTPVKPRVSKGS
jgi:hypothetical protein